MAGNRGNRGNNNNNRRQQFDAARPTEYEQTAPPILAKEPPGLSNRARDDLTPLLTPFDSHRLGDLEEKTAQRRVVFVVALLLALAFFVLLFCALINLFHGDLVDFVAVAGRSNWHVLVFLGVALVITASIPLSIFLALVRALNTDGDRAQNGDATTPALSLVQSLADLAKLITDKAKSN